MDKVFPKERFGNYISEEDFKKRLKELKIEEQKAKSYNNKKWLKNLRAYLEEETGLKSNY